jgi:hypothetical protein
MTLKRLPYGEEYLDWYYNKGGMRDVIYGLDSVYGPTPAGEKMGKAVGIWDAPTSPYAYYFEPIYAAKLYMWTIRNSEVLRLLPKTTFLAEGDSLKYVETDLAGLTGIGNASTPFTSGSAESGPSITELNELKPAHVIDPWETGLTARTYSTYQKDPKYDPAFLKDYHAKLLPHQLDVMLCKTVDTVANDGSTNLNIESIDRIVSDYTESGAGTTYVNAATDGDLYWGNSAALVDRSADTDDTFGGAISLPASAAARVLSLDMIDDVIADASRYSSAKRYVGITGPLTINEMQKLIDPKQRYLDNPMNVQVTMNGVSTRAGEKTGFTVASYVSNGIEIPIFPCNAVAGEISTNISGTVTTQNIGNIYFLDLDAIELREAFPITYMETPPEAMLSRDVMTTRHAFLYAAQLLATNFRAHAAVKYLKST